MGDTYAEALARVGVGVPPHLVAEAEVPVLGGPQAQGDLLVFPTDPVEAADDDWDVLGPEGAVVLQGEATGHTHWLHPGFESDRVRWMPVSFWDVQVVAPPPGWTDDPLTVGYLDVPQGQSALLIHTDEHGANGIGPGHYAVHRKREGGEDAALVWD
jgi:hypothetical protein